MDLCHTGKSILRSPSAVRGVTWRDARVKALPAQHEGLKGYRSIGNLVEPWKSSIVPRLREKLVTEPAHCSAYAYINMVIGKRDFALYSRVHPWDHVAGVLMFERVGWPGGISR